jgi:heterodisulfide reductase subunit D
MSESSFEAALAEQVEHLLDACTRCGKCFEVCPITEAAGIPPANSESVVAGVLDILRGDEGPETARKWASSCVLSGECIKA